MKIYFILTAVICVVMVLFPFLPKAFENHMETTASQVVSETDKTSAETDKEEIRVLRTSSDNVITVSLFDYIVGVVAGEMPASFCEEALKAQAVVSYTYAKWLMTNSNTDKNSDISDSSSIHQKYIDIDEQKEKWQDTYDSNRKKIENVVKSVLGQYLTFNGETAMTVFHAMSSGETLSANEVWGEDIPYLTQVEAPGDTLAEKYESTVTFTADEFRELFEKNTEIKFEEENYKKWASVKEKSDKGYIEILTVCSTDFSSRDIRKILSLPSSAFKASLNDGCFVFSVYGKGHGVGMSQYSADYMARQGSSYTDILSHFYPGTTISQD